MTTLQKLLANQATSALIFEKSVNNYNRTEVEKRTKGLISERLNALSEIWSDYKNTHYTILQATQPLEASELQKYDYFANDQFSSVENKYYTFRGILRDALDAFETKVESKPNTENESSSFLRLPSITIPKFSGSYESWRSFRDLFQSLVHTNSALSPVQKLHYLKSNISGEAEHLLRQLPMTNASYDNAWKILLNRYDNKRVLINAQLKVLFNLPKATQESAKALKTVLDKSSECIYELEALEVPTKHWDIILIYMLVQCLPAETHRLWEQDVNSLNELPTLKSLQKFLEKRFRTLEAIADTKPHLMNKPAQIPKVSTHFTSSGDRCTLCKEQHRLYKCPKFVKLDVDAKFKIVTSNSLCINCLSKGHNAKFCSSKFTCQRCGRKHHSLLHRNSTNTQSSHKTTPNSLERVQPCKSPSTSNIHSLHASQSVRTTQALLATALLKVPSRKGTMFTLRALIDSGSQVSFITQAAARKLQLAIMNTSIQITGLGKSEAMYVKKQVTIDIHPYSTSNKVSTIDALVVNTITDILPPSTIPNKEWSHVRDLQLADPYFFKSGKIDLLLGADVYGEILLEGLRKGPTGTPIAQNSMLGWILFGNLNSTSTISKASALTANAYYEEESPLDKLLRRFWEVEEFLSGRQLSRADCDCEEFYKKTHFRDTNGRYEVRLPFINESPSLGDSRGMAVRRFHSLERKLQQNPELSQEYKAYIDEYQSLGHMTAVDKEVNKDKCYYLPHHAVIKESTTTKVRVVFDASAKSSNGKSLNEQLHTGPVLQSELFSTLLRWRKYKFAMSADIEKMYRMINVQSPDQNYQRIVWRNNPNEVIKDFKLTTVTFGTTPAPYLAIKTLHQVATDEAAKYPIAARIIPRGFYVDDLLTGADSIEEALEIQKQLINLLSSAGFNLRKWVSNSSDLLSSIPEEHREVQLPLRFASDESVKTLGIHWHPGTDHFTLQNKQFADRISTKRSVLSEIASLFDPLGWISPIVVTAKILMQTLWLSGCSWDDQIPAHIDQHWRQFKAKLSHISTIHIPRWVCTTSDLSTCQIHGFSDASNQAYSAAVYIRAIDHEGNVHVNLLIAKSKIAPVKPVTLPRLELCGAVLLARLINRVKTDLKFDKVPIFAWTDSSIVLAWIRNHPNKYKTYVANRIAEIQNLIDIPSWRHVRSVDNPADCNSRGIEPTSLSSHKIWWHGPQWLLSSEENWPQSKPLADKIIESEQKQVSCLTTTYSDINELLCKFSTFVKLQRVIAYCFRFINHSRKTSSKTHRNSSLLLKASEMIQAKHLLIKLAQRTAFEKEIKQLKAGNSLPTKSNILSLNPFLDQDELLRVGGRLQNANIPFNQKHPIILPKESNLTILIINHFHTKTLHGGLQLVLSTLRNEFWIPQGRKTVKHILHKCVTCFKQSASSRNQIMGNLPASRVNISRPFQQTGVDYAGPINLKMSKHRGNRFYKGYICIFVCMATKAIHIEPVSDLTTAAFIAAFRRFTSRRGPCTDIYSDCGTNFVGADKILQKDLKNAMKQANEEMAAKVAQDGTRWHFNPPSAPHFGGLWEAGVKSIKFHLKRILGNSSLTFEEFATVLSQIEACLNSRPLCPISDNPDDLDILTPGHFLIGSSLITPPEPIIETNTSSITRWNHIQLLQQQFWNKWSNDYLNSLQNRPKWKNPISNPKIGDLVVIKEPNLPACRWVLGRIIELHPGVDKMVRVVSMKTQNGVLKRPITKLAILPLS